MSGSRPAGQTNWFGANHTHTIPSHSIDPPSIQLFLLARYYFVVTSFIEGYASVGLGCGWKNR